VPDYCVFQELPSWLESNALKLSAPQQNEKMQPRAINPMVLAVWSLRRIGASGSYTFGGIGATFRR
jgi:hypothetical protein